MEKTRVQNGPGEFKTADLYYSAYLKVAGVPLVDTRREGSRVYFIFEDSPNLKDLKREYYNRTAKVPAMSYADEIQAMKNLVYAT